MSASTTGPLEVHQVERLTALAEERGGIHGFAVLLGLHQGLRRDEIAAAAWADFAEDGWLKLIGKDHEPARIRLHPVVAAALGRLPHEHPVWVFPGWLEKSAVAAWSWLAPLATEAGVENVTPHRLRRTWLRMARGPITQGDS